MGVLFNPQRPLAVAAAIAVVLLAACSNPFTSNTNAAPQRSATLSRGTLLATVSATGNIHPESEVSLVFQASGKVTQVNVTSGDIVKQGDVLARLDATDLEAALAQAQAGLMLATASYSRTLQGPLPEDVAAAQSALNAANAAYAKLQAGPDDANVAAAETAVRTAEAALRQAQTINDLTYKFDTQNYPGSPAITQLQQAKNNLDAARTQYDRVLRAPDKSQVASAVQQITAARAQLEKLKQPVKQYDVDQALAQVEKARLQVKQAQLHIDQTKLVAPLDAVVSQVNIVVGQATAPGVQPAIVLVDTSRLHIDITVDEIDVSKVKPGQVVSVTLDALPGVELRGTVDRVASTSNLVSGVVSYAVRVLIENTSAPLRTGMTANATIVLDQRSGVLLAPNWAIRKDKQSGKAFVTLKTGDKTTQEIEIKTGLRNDAFSEVVSGASDGQIIVAPQTPNFLGQ